MPFIKKPYTVRKKNLRRKRNYRKRRYPVKTTSLAMRIPSGKVYPFSRGQEHLLNLSAPDGGWVTTLDNCLVKSFSFSLNNLLNHSEFVNLFGQYKLNMAIMKFFPSASQVVIAAGPAASQNMIITVWRNTHGVPLTTAFLQTELLEIQNKKQWMFPLNRPTSIKMPLKQLSETYQSIANTDYATVKPRYISTTEPGTPHYGYNVHIRKVDGTSFGSVAPVLLTRTRIYLTCKQVK